MAVNEHESTPYPQKRSNYPEISTPENRRQVGKELKSAREFQEMTLEQIYAVTKINTKFLENLEEGRWNFLPPTYVKAFIRSYASAVQLPLDKLSSRLDDMFSNIVTPYAPVRPNFSGSDDEVDEYTKQPRNVGFFNWVEHNRTYLFYTIIGVIVVVVIAIYLSRPVSVPVAEKSPLNIPAKTTPSPAESLKVTTPSDTKPVAIADTSAKKNQTMHVQIATRDTCYVKIEHSDSVIYERTLWPGGLVQFDLPQVVRMTLGNAPVVELKLNNESLPPFPEGRRTRSFQLTPTGITG